MLQFLQDMACDTLVKIAKKCSRCFVEFHEGEPLFIEEMLGDVSTIICNLEPNQKLFFYEAVGYMISAQTEQSIQESLIERVMLLPNQSWDEIINQVTQNVGVLKDAFTVKQLMYILKVRKFPMFFITPMLQFIVI